MNLLQRAARGIKRMARALIVAIIGAIKLLIPIALLLLVLFLVVVVVVSVDDSEGVNESFFSFLTVSDGDTDANSPKVHPVPFDDSETAVEDETPKEIPTRDVSVNPEPQNAGIKAFYYVMAQRSMWQIDDDGNLLNITADETKQDYLNRDEGLYINPNLLYALNEACYGGEGLMYPEQFIKPVAYTYEDGKFELCDLVDDEDKVTVDSQIINEENGKPAGKTDKFVGDYGFGTVAHYTSKRITKTLKGSYVSYEEYDPLQCQVVTKNYEKPEAFSINMGSEDCDLIDGVVTFLGVKNYETTFEESIEMPCKDGKTSKETDVVKQVYYKSVSVDLYTATKGTGKDMVSVADKTEAWCKANGFTPIAASRHTVSYDLYKNRSDDSGVYSNAPKPEDGEEDIKGSLEYFNDYLMHFKGYVPAREGRHPYLFKNLTSIATVDDVKSGGVSAGGNSGETGGADYVKKFIDTLKDAALKAQKESGMSAALIIAQAAWESGWGKSGLAVKGNNYFGIKWTEGCGYDYVEMSTREGSGASAVTIKAKFRKYKDVQECLDDWCRIMWNGKNGNSYRYRDAAGKSYKEALSIIHDGGYCTENKETYVNGIAGIVESNDLGKLEKDASSQWDGTPPPYADKDIKSGKKGKSIGSTDYAGNLSEEDAKKIDEILNMYLNDKDVITTDYYETEYRKVQIFPDVPERRSVLYTAVAFSNHLYKSEVELYSDKQIMKVLLANSEGDNSEQDGGTYVGDGEYMWVVPSCTTITSPFGNRTSPTAGASSYHRGIDIGCAEGSDVVATKDGTVEVAEQSPSEGLWIQIDHGGDIKSVYMHNSKLLVKKGDTVKKGQVIAKSGSTGISTGPHCHFGIKVKGEYVNPLDYVNPQETITKKVSANSITDGTTKSDFASSVEDSDVTDTRKKMVAYARKFLGNPYVYGGTSLTKGTDCSGFTMRIYEHFGVTLPRTAAQQYSASKHIEKKDLLPGDLIFYKDSSGNIGHVTMYIGGGKVIHASTSKTGIIISNINYRTACGYGRFDLKKSTTKASKKTTEAKKSAKKTTEKTTESKKSSKKKSK